ncbi:hypothetical protein [Roseivivax isoporae]|uniref:50S ribosomal protein L35 n=1 Tax=Roseivivax isoporae LMG 25204 TaxID=1449351 RepID=X7F3N5_9RHOB|nr:hypothetical protein [Roseivivax isoporae]ETX27420.1 50S ribosomal protein L35 [Roseivivax isoporae LMG 25204]
MNPDLSLTLGLVLAAVAIPSSVSAFSDGRTPRIPALAIVAAGLLVLYAVRTRPGGYALHDVPRAIYRTIALLTG